MKKLQHFIYTTILSLLLCLQPGLTKKAKAQIDTTKIRESAEALALTAAHHVEIIKEGFTLYLHEKIAWLGSDAYENSSKRGNAQLYFTYITDSTFHSVFGNDNGEAVFESIINSKNFSFTSFDTIRPMSSFEQELYTQKKIFYIN
jgi:hypothetical protein